MRATNVIDVYNPAANMYGCLPCPKCGGVHRCPIRKDAPPERDGGQIICCECDFKEPWVEKARP